MLEGADRTDRDQQTRFNFIRECARHFLVCRRYQGVIKNLSDVEKAEISTILGNINYAKVCQKMTELGHVVIHSQNMLQCSNVR